MEENITIRKETKDDVGAIFNLNHYVFGQDSEAKLVDALRRNPEVFVPGLSLVATKNNQIVGHILFSKITIKDKNENRHESLALAPMAVRPDLHRCGIGGNLIKKGFEEALKLGFKSVIVLGHEHYYPKFGFKPAIMWHINAPFDVPSTAFMAIALEKDGLKDVSGTVIYPKEFELV